MSKLGKKNAFPDGGICGGGMTLREYYAGMALQGALASTVNDESWPQPTPVAEKSVEYADALLEALEADK